MPVSSSKLRYRVAACSFFFAQGMLYSSWASRNKDIKEFFEKDDGEWGNILFAAALGQLCAMAISGFLVAKYGSRFCLKLAIVLYPVALIMLGVVPEAWQLFIALFFFGMTGNLYNISVNTQAVGVERLYKPKSILSFFHGMWSLGGFAAGGISSLLMDWGVSPRNHFLMVFVFSIFILFLMGGSLLPRDKKPEKKHGRRFVKPDRYILILGIIAFSSMMCEGTVFNWCTIYMNNVVQATGIWVGMGYTAFMATMTTGRFLGDKLVNYFGSDFLFKVGGSVTAAGLLIVALFPEVWSAIAGLLLVGLGVSAIVPVCYSMAGRSKTMHPGVAVASISTIGFLGFLVGPPLIGAISKTWGLQWSFGLVSCVGAGIVYLGSRLKHIQRKV